MRGLFLSMSAWAILGFVGGGCNSGGTEATSVQASRGSTSPTTSVSSSIAAHQFIFSGEEGTFVAFAGNPQPRKVFDLPEIWEFQPDVSPDGRRVALRADERSRAEGGTWVVDIDGSDPRNLSNAAGVRGGSPDWSPDGRSLVYTGKRRADRHFGLWIVDTETTRARRITPDEWEAQYPAWSPDGRWIAFTKVVAPNDFSIFRISPDGSRLRRLSRTDYDDNYPAWSPDSTQIVFHSERSENAGLWIMEADGSDERFLTEGGEPQWEPGEWIIFDCPVSAEAARICAVAPDGSGLTVLPLDRDGGFPNWLP